MRLAELIPNPSSPIMACRNSSGPISPNTSSRQWSQARSAAIRPDSKTGSVARLAVTD